MLIHSQPQKEEGRHDQVQSGQHQMINDNKMDIEAFQDLPTETIAGLMRKRGPKICGFPINGTRRWYLLEAEEGDHYLEKVARRHTEIYRLLFDHGIDTLLAPVFGSELLNRGADYLKLAVEGLRWLVTNPVFLNLYQEYEVRVHFYGNYRKQLASTPYADVSDSFDQLTLQTSRNTHYRLFFGVFADNATCSISEQTLQYFTDHGHAPSERESEELYFGEYVGPVNLFIGFDKFSVFDMPLVPTENTDLYFTVNPSLYLSQRQLRAILFDHLFTRASAEPDYDELAAEAKKRMRNFYYAHTESVLGTGVLRDGIWYPHLPATNPELP